jgi:hypothetical protein
VISFRSHSRRACGPRSRRKRGHMLISEAERQAKEVEWFVGRVLDASRYPRGFPRRYQVAYRPASRAASR